MDISLAFIPLCSAMAILRTHLWDIDIIIRRTLIYVPLTALLAGLYAASTAVLQKLFVALTGEKSDVATVLTTLVVVAAFDPIKRGVQYLIDLRFKEVPDPARKLKGFAEQVRLELGVIDPHRIARRLLEEAANAFGAKGGAVWLGASETLIHTTGRWEGSATLSMPMETANAKVGMIALTERSNGAHYSSKDRAVLQQVVTAVAMAIDQESASSGYK
jgi:hypothetical protein